MLFPPLGPAAAARAPRARRREARGVRRHVLPRSTRLDDAGRLPAGDRRHLGDGEPDRQRAAHRRGGARASAGRAARGRRPAADGVPGPLSPARGRSCSAGRPTSSFPAFCRDYLARGATPADGRRAAARDVRRSRRATATACASTTRPCTTRRRRSRRSRCRTAATSTTPPTSASGRRPATGRPRCSPRSAAPTAASSAPSRSSATTCAARPLDAVFAEIDDILRLGYDGLWIADDTFTLRRDYLEEFCRRMAPLGLHVELPLARQRHRRRRRPGSCARPAAAGSTSGSSPAARRRSTSCSKQMTVEQGVRAAAVYRDAGIEVAAFFIVGYPGETAADIERTFALRARPAARRDLVQRADAAARVGAVGAARRARTRGATGRTRTTSPSSSAPTSTRRGCGGGSTRRWRRSRRSGRAPPEAAGRRARGVRPQSRTSAQAPEERLRRRLREPGGGGAEAPEPPPQLELRRGPRGSRSASWRPRSRPSYVSCWFSSEAAVGPRLAA